MELSGGVPQGSMLRPLLFIIYVNYISDKSKQFTVNYGDDANLSIKQSNYFTIYSN